MSTTPSQRCHVSEYTVHPGLYCASSCAVTGQLADTPTRGLPTRGLDDSQTGQLADGTARGLDKSRTGQLAMSSPRVGNPQVGVSSSCPVTSCASHN